MSDARCRSCSALVVWAKTVKGKNMPLDLSPDSAGKFILEDGVARYLRPGERADGRLTYTSHFSTCPQAGSWRR